MATTENVILKVSADTTEVTKGIEQVGTSVDETKSSVGGLTSGLDRMTGGAISGFKLMLRGIMSGVLGLRTLKGAVAATGIGLLVIAVAGLVSYFKDTERGAQKLRVITATLGAVMDKLKDVVIGLGEKIFNAFSNPKEAVIALWETIKTNLVNRLMGLMEWIPALGKALKQVFEGDFTGAAKTAADAAGKIALGVENITDVMAEAADQTLGFAAALKKAADDAAALAKRENDLKVGEREFLIVRANTNKLIAEKRLLVEDETLSYDKRVAALEIAIAAERETIKVELQFAQERAEILAAKAALAESDEETLLAVAEAEAEVVRVKTRSLKAEKRLEGERQSILLQRDAKKKTDDAKIKKDQDDKEKKEQDAIDKKAAADEVANQAIIKAKQDLEDELFLLGQTAREREEFAVMQQFDRRVALAGDDEGLIKQATVLHNDAMKAIDDDYLAKKKAADDKLSKSTQDNNQKDIDGAKAAFQAKIDFALKALGALSALNEAFAGDTEKQQKKAFQRNKAIGISSAIISTAGAVIGAINPASGGLGIPAGLPGAAIAAATGIAQIATIAKTRFKSGAGTSPSSPSGGGGGAAGPPIPTAPQLDLSFLGGGAGQDGFRTYVIASEVSNSQQANQRINDQAALVG